MLNENAKKWVEALRSGKYRQGKHYLTQRDPEEGETDCCLGVACKLFVAENPDVLTVASHRDEDGETEVVKYGEVNDCLPQVVQDWLGVATDIGRFNPNAQCLTSKNDCEGKTFAEIADIIESEPPGLFVATPQEAGAT